MRYRRFGSSDLMASEVGFGVWTVGTPMWGITDEGVGLRLLRKALELGITFYDTADVYANLQDFMIMILRDRLGVPAPDSRKAAEAIARGAREFRLWLDEA